jgi:hypothetical protein
MLVLPCLATWQETGNDPNTQLVSGNGTWSKDEQSTVAEPAIPASATWASQPKPQGSLGSTGSAWAQTGTSSAPAPLRGPLVNTEEFPSLAATAKSGAKGKNETQVGLSPADLKGSQRVITCCSCCLQHLSRHRSSWDPRCCTGQPCLGRRRACPSSQRALWPWRTTRLVGCKSSGSPRFMQDAMQDGRAACCVWCSQHSCAATFRGGWHSASALCNSV